MKSISEIKNLLYKVAKSQGTSGVSIDLAVDLLAQNIYYNQANNAAVIANNNVDSTKSMNVLIKYALDNLYPIYRGRCSIVEFKMSIVHPKINLKVGDKVFSYKNYNLYLLEDISYDQDTEVLDWNATQTDKVERIVRCLVSTEYKTNVPFNTGGAFYVDSEGRDGIHDASEDVMIFENSTGTNIPVPFTKYLSEHIDDILVKYSQHNIVTPTVDQPLPLLMTSYDYGLRLYPSSLVQISDIVEGSNKSYIKVDKDKLNKSYVANYAVYSEIIPKVSDFRTFNIPGLTVVNDPAYPKIEPYVPRENIDSGLAYKVKVNLVQFQRIRANFDLINSFNTYFREYLIDSSFSRSGSGDAITIYYIARPGKTIPSNLFEEFRGRFLYHITSQITGLVKSTKVEVPIQIHTYSTTLIDESLITEAVSSFNYKSNTKITYEQVLARINKIPGIKYSRISTDETPNIGRQDTSAVIRSLDYRQYILFKITSVNQHTNETE